jgi:hypothetical protein
MFLRNLILVFALLSSARGAIFEFDLGPNGMNGANERPNPLSTVATGGEYGEPGISYDDSTHKLFLNFAWGSSLGYTDLQSAFVQAEICGPATVDEDAEQLYSLTPLVNPLTQNGLDGGVFGFNVTLVENPEGRGYTIPQQETQLKSGQWFLNVGTRLHSQGEIRGQLLLAVPEPREYALATGIALAVLAIFRTRQKYPRGQKTPA